MTPTDLTPLHGRVLGFFGDHIVATIDEIADALALDAETVAKVCAELVRAGLLASLSDN